MTDRELKKLSRTDLIEMLLEVTRENEQLRQELTDTRQKLDSKTIAIENAGSLAEAALQLNGLFEAAQNACDQYVQNMQERGQSCVPAEPAAQIESPAEPAVQACVTEQAVCAEQEVLERCSCMEREMQEKCSRMEQEMQEKCACMERDTQEKCDRMLKRAKQDADEYWEYVRANARELHKSSLQDQI